MPNREFKGQSLVKIVSDYTVIDLETTGKYIDSCEVIEMAAVKVRNAEIIDSFSTLVRPHKEIPALITALTGITNEMVSEAPECTDALKDFLNFIGDDIVAGHNIVSFDVNILYDLSMKYLGAPFTNDMLDTCRFSRYCDIQPENYKLTTLTAYFGIDHDSAHRALADCIANQKCYEMLKPLLTYQYSSAPRSNASSGRRISKSTKLLKELMEFINYAISDAYLSNDEIMALEEFLSENQELSGNYPYDILYKKIYEILDDGIITEIERKELIEILTEISDPVQYRLETCCDGSELDFTGKKVCLTGEFYNGSRAEIESRFQQAGAIITHSVSSKTDYLIVGGMGSTEWACGNYGNKVKKALELQDAGKAIQIIREEAAIKCLNLRELLHT